jgi:DNA-directed RNA polymerase omega subunit
MKHDDSLLYPTLQKLLERIPQKYELVLAATRRAKQILRQQRLNPAGFSEADLHRKPLTIALTDIVEERVDKEALMALDLEFDDIEQEQEDMFPDAEGFGRPLSETASEDEPTDEPADASDDTDDDADDAGDLDMFDLGVSAEEE